LITPDLAALSSGDFDKTRQLIAAGEAAAEALLPQLRRYAVAPLAYADWQLRRTRQGGGAPRLAPLPLHGTHNTHPALMHNQRQPRQRRAGRGAGARGGGTRTGDPPRRTHAGGPPPFLRKERNPGGPKLLPRRRPPPPLFPRRPPLPPPPPPQPPLADALGHR